MQQHVYCLGHVSLVLVMCSLPGLVEPFFIENHAVYEILTYLLTYLLHGAESFLRS